MNDDIQNLQNQITPETLGVFWITTDKLEKIPRPFHAIDYFLDGLLSHPSQKKTGKNNFFVSRSFRQDFFVSHLHDDGNELNKELKETMELIIARKSSQKNILLLDEKPQNRIQFLTKNYPEFNFKQIDYILGESDNISNP